MLSTQRGRAMIPSMAVRGKRRYFLRRPFSVLTTAKDSLCDSHITSIHPLSVYGEVLSLLLGTGMNKTVRNACLWAGAMVQSCKSRHEFDTQNQLVERNQSLKLSPGLP